MLAVAVGGTGSSARVANPGDQVVIVYNTRVPESKAVADYYAARRLVPTNQIFGFALSTNDDISRTEFRDDLQKPLAQGLTKRKLWQIGQTIVPATTNRPGRVEWKPVESKIRYALLCYGVPLRIEKDPGDRPKFFPTRLETNAGYLGAQIGAKFGQAFYVQDALKIEDPLPLFK